MHVCELKKMVQLRALIWPQIQKLIESCEANFFVDLKDKDNPTFKSANKIFKVNVSCKRMNKETIRKLLERLANKTSDNGFNNLTTSGDRSHGNLICFWRL